MIYELPSFARYIVFHQEHSPRIITHAGEMVELIKHDTKPTVLK